MATKIRGTEGTDKVIQGNRTELDIRTFGGNDQIKLDRDDDLGGDNFVDAGDGRDVVVNFFEGGNTIRLGSGNDLYVGTGFSLLNFADVVDGGTGNDRMFVQTLFSTYKGGAGNDFFASTGWRNVFNGGTGNDTISYEFRHEDSTQGDTGVIVDLAFGATATGGQSREKLVSIENAIGSENADQIGGTNGANRLNGLGGDDEIFGFGGKDVITGGKGSDFVAGGTQADLFVFRSVAESRSGSFDEIADFSSADGDRIDLSAIDASTRAGGNQAFSFIGGAAFSGHAGELRFSGGFVTADTDGNRIADLVIQIDDTTSMVRGDFLL